MSTAKNKAKGTTKVKNTANNDTGLRVAALDLVAPDVLKQLRTRSDVIGLALVAHAWLIIFASMAMVYYIPNPLTIILAIMFIGNRQLGLAILMHDAAHNALMRSAWLNDRISNWFCAYPIIAHTGAYRSYHLQHHARTQQDDDPDLVLSKPFPITRASLKRKMIRDLTGQTAYQQRKTQVLNALGPADWPLRQRLHHFGSRLGGAVLAQLTILVLCAIVFHWSFYIFFWLVPFFTYHMAITRIRNIAEHAVVPDNNDPFRNARTTHASWLERIFIAPYWVNYHVEHHLLMYVPCYRLPELHRALAAQGLASRMETATGYWDIMRRACSLDDNNHPGNDQNPNKGKTSKTTSRLQGTMGEGFSHS